MTAFNSTPVALAKLHEDSHHTVDARFDIFKVPPTETSQTGHTMTTYQPLNESLNSSQVQIYAPPNADGHTDLRNSYLLVEYKVVKANGTAIGAVGDIACYPKASTHGLFERMTFALNNTDVYHNGAYSQTVHMRYDLEETVGSKKGRLAGEGWLQDDHLASDHADVPAAVVAARKATIAGSKTVSSFLRLTDPLSDGRRYIPPGYAIKMTFHRAPDSTFLMSGDANDRSKVVITKLELHLRKVFGSPSVNRAQTLQLVKGADHKLPVKKHRTRSFHIPAGVKSHRIALQQEDYLPLKVIVGLVGHAAVSGDLKLSPYKYANNKVATAELTLDGSPVGQRFVTDFSTGRCAQAYASLLQATNFYDSSETNGLTYDDFRNNDHTYFAWVTSSDLPNEEWHNYFHLKRKGALALTFTFAEATAQSLSAQVLDVREDLILLDAEQRIRATESVV